MAPMRPYTGMRTIKVTFNQLTCLYQLYLVKGVSVICGLVDFGLYFGSLFGSDVEAIGDGCEERYSGLIAKWPAVG